MRADISDMTFLVTPTHGRERRSGILALFVHQRMTLGACLRASRRAPASHSHPHEQLPPCFESSAQVARGKYFAGNVSFSPAPSSIARRSACDVGLFILARDDT